METVASLKAHIQLRGSAVLTSIPVFEQQARKGNRISVDKTLRGQFTV